MRVIYLAPIIHTFKEMGLKFQGAIEGAFKNGSDGGIEKANQLMALAEKIWVAINENLQIGGFYTPEKASTVHIFVDSLTWDVTQKKIEEIFNGLVKDRIPLGLVVGELEKNGATIHGTEDPALLRREVDCLERLMKGEYEDDDGEFLINCLEERNKAIVECINEIVPDGHCALLFMGFLHTQGIIFFLEQLSSNKRFEVNFLAEEDLMPKASLFF